MDARIRRQEDKGVLHDARPFPRRLRERHALFELGEARFDTDALEARRERRANEFEHELQVHVPRAAREVVAEPEEACRLTLDAERDEHR